MISNLSLNNRESSKPSKELNRLTLVGKEDRTAIDQTKTH